MRHVYEKQIRAIAQGGSWQGFQPEQTVLSDWVNENQKQSLIKKWTKEEMFKVTHDRMRYLTFEERFVEI